MEALSPREVLVLTTEVCTPSHSLAIDTEILVQSADLSGYGIETDKWGHEHNPWAKREEAPTAVPTRTHHRAQGSPAPDYNKDSFLGLKSSKFDRKASWLRTMVIFHAGPEALSLAEEIYSILEETETELGDTSSVGG